MKKVTLFLLSSYLFIAAANAQTNKVENDSLINSNKYYLHVFSLANSKFEPSFEFIIKDGKKGLMIAPVIIQKGKEKEGLGLNVQYRSYYRIDPPNFPQFKKLYMAPYVFYEYIENTVSSPSTYGYTNGAWSNIPGSSGTDFISQYGGGIIFGTQLYMFNDRLVFDVYLGGGIQRSDINNQSGNSYNDSVFEEGYSGVVPTGGFQLGFVF